MLFAAADFRAMLAFTLAVATPCFSAVFRDACLPLMPPAMMAADSHAALPLLLTLLSLLRTLLTAVCCLSYYAIYVAASVHC